MAFDVAADRVGIDQHATSHTNSDQLPGVEFSQHGAARNPTE
jgi:hypothetical protein